MWLEKKREEELESGKGKNEQFKSNDSKIVQVKNQLWLKVKKIQIISMKSSNFSDNYNHF